MKKCQNTNKSKLSIKEKLEQLNKRDSSAGRFITSSAGAVTSLILVVAVCGLINLFGFIGVDDTYAEYTISMTSSGAQSIDVIPGDNGGINTTIAEDAISITTTCPAGYKLSTSTSVNDNNLYLNGSSSNNTTGTYFSPSDGTTSLGNATNTWGYYYDDNSSTAPTGNSIFHAVPAVNSPVASIKTSSNTSDSFSVYYGVAVDIGLTAGTYKMIPDTNNSNADGSIVYYLLMADACLPKYTVVYNPTSVVDGHTVTGTGAMNNQSIPVGVATALTTNAFAAPTGFEFNGWNTAQDGSGTSYTDGQSVTDLASGNTSITLYAQWKPAFTFDQSFDFAGKTKHSGTSGDYYVMQDMTVSVCVNVIPGQTTTLYDSRNNYEKTYTVAKIGGTCVMTQNLAITGTIPAEGSNFTGSDITPDYTDYSHLASSYIGRKVAVAHATYGAYYNYCIASVGTVCSNTKVDATADICPAEWQIPSYDTWGLVGGASNAASLFSAQLGGYLRSNSSSPTGTTYGYYWSSTADSANYPYALKANASALSSVISSTNYRYNGQTIRCANAPHGITINVTAGDGVSTVSINGGTAGTTATGTFRQGEKITITATASSNDTRSVYTWTSTGAGTLEAGYSTGSSFSNLFTVGGGTGNITVAHIADATTEMQDLDTSSCTTDGLYVYDNRDNEIYLVKKLADNKCWMLDNLRLDLTNSDIVDGLTSTNTNASDEALGYLKSTTTPRDPSTDSTGKWPTAALTKSNWTSSYSYSAPLVNASGTFNGNPYTKDTVVAGYGEGSGKIGVYYNYCAASAGSYCYGNGTQNTGSPSSDPVSGSLRDITDDICPKGWRMPTSSSSGEYQALYAAYSSASEGQQNAFRANLSTPLSGYFYNGSAGNQGGGGYFCSSTWYGTDGMYVLSVSASNVIPSSNGDRHIGDSVRCTLDS